MPDLFGPLAAGNWPGLLDAVCDIWLIFLIYSMLGWASESFCCSVKQRRLINRGFLNGPYCPIYGSGALLCVLLLSWCTHPVALFFLSGLLCCVLEFLTSVVMERTYNARWWDYSKRPLNIQGRVWIGGFFEFAACCTVVMLWLHPWVLFWVSCVPAGWLWQVAGLSATIFWSDFAVSHAGAAGLRRKAKQLLDSARSRMGALVENIRSIPALTEVLNSPELADRLYAMARTRMGGAGHRLREAAAQIPSHLPSVDDLVDTFHSSLSIQQKRMINAYPTLYSADLHKFVDDLQKTLANYGNDVKDQ